MPRICKDAHVQCQDILMHLLYSGAADSLLRSLIAQSVQNIKAEFKSSGVADVLKCYELPPETGLATLRAVFFVLLNHDSSMRSLLCHRPLTPHLPQLCPYKACRLYDELKDNVLLGWVKDETRGLLDLVESITEAYLVA